MQTVEMFKNKSQTYMGLLLEKAKAPPSEVKTWGITASGALAGAVTMAAATQGLLALLTVLSTPPVPLTVGAVSGGVLGWYYMRERQRINTSDAPPTALSLPAIDDLEMITGISATYASRLRAAGIVTFAQLAAVTPERVHLIIGPTYYSNIIQSERWIREARVFAEQAPCLRHQYA